MASHPAAKFFRSYNGPVAMTAGCLLCKHVDIVPKGWSPGKGFGWREGGKQRGRMIQHIKSAHPEALGSPE